MLLLVAQLPPPPPVIAFPQAQSGHFGDKALESVRAAKNKSITSKPHQQLKQPHIPIAIIDDPPVRFAMPRPVSTPSGDGNALNESPSAAPDLPRWDSISRYNEELKNMKPDLDKYQHDASILLSWFQSVKSHDDPLDHGFLVHLNDMVRTLCELQIWGPDFQARLDRMQHNVQKTIELIYSDETRDRNKGNMLLITDILRVKEQVSLILDFIHDVMNPLHEYFNGTDFYTHIIPRSANNRGERHQLMWNDRAKVALLDPLILIITARIKEAENLYHNLFAYNSATKERTTEIVGTVNNIFEHVSDLEEIMSNVLFWQDKSNNTPQGRTHDFAMTTFERIKNLDHNFSRMLDALLEGEENVSLVECLLEGTNVPPVEWKPITQINRTFAEAVRLEQWGRIKELPPTHKYPELEIGKKEPKKDQDMRFVNLFLREVNNSRNLGGQTKKRTSDEPVASTSGTNKKQKP